MKTLNTAYTFIWKVISDYCIIYKEKGSADKSWMALIHFFGLVPKTGKKCPTLGQRCPISAILMLPAEMNVNILFHRGFWKSFYYMLRFH